MQEKKGKTAEPVLNQAESATADIKVCHEVVDKRFPELTVCYVQERDKTYVLAWGRYVFEELAGDVRAQVKRAIKARIYSWILKLTMYVAYREAFKEETKNAKQNG